MKGSLKIGVKVVVAALGGLIGGMVVFAVGLAVIGNLVPRSTQYRYEHAFDATVWGSMVVIFAVLLWRLLRSARRS